MSKAPSVMLKEKLLQKAESLGFDLVKATSPEPLIDAKIELERRPQLGISIPLSACTPKERTTPAFHLPGVQSIVKAAVDYSVEPALLQYV